MDEEIYKLPLACSRDLRNVYILAWSLQKLLYVTTHCADYLANLFLPGQEDPWGLPSSDYLGILHPEVVDLCVGGNPLVNVVPILDHVDHLVLPKSA